MINLWRTVVSTSEDQSEFLLSCPAKSLLLRSSHTWAQEVREVLHKRKSELVSRSTSVIFSDVEFGAALPTRPIIELEKLYRAIEQCSATHIYVVIQSRLKLLVELLKSPPIFSGAVLPLLIYAGKAYRLPAIYPQAATSPACIANAMLTDIPSLRSRFERNHAIEPENEVSTECIAGAIRSIVYLDGRPKPHFNMDSICVLDTYDGSIHSYTYECAGCGHCPAGPINPHETRSFGGIVKSVVPSDVELFPFHILIAKGSATHGSPSGGGVALDNSIARKKALYELYERHVSARLPVPVRLATAEQLGIDPEPFNCFLPHQLGKVCKTHPVDA